MMKSLIPLSMLLLPMAVQARAQDRSTTVHVSYADLDLARAQDRKTLDRRLARALDQVCGVDRPGYLTPSPEIARCRASTKPQLAAARTQVVAQRAAAVRISAVP